MILFLLIWTEFKTQILCKKLLRKLRNSYVKKLFTWKCYEIECSVKCFVWENIVKQNLNILNYINCTQNLIDIVQSNTRKLFCCLIDFKQAFDSVWTNGLWYKLRKEKINGKCFNVIYHLYSNIKSKVVTSEGLLTILL
jgi:hypothetical protein